MSKWLCVGAHFAVLVSLQVSKKIWVEGAVEGQWWERFGQSVSCVVFGANMSETNEASGDGFADAHDLARKVFLIDLGGRRGSVDDDG